MHTRSIVYIASLASCVRIENNHTTLLVLVLLRAKRARKRALSHVVVDEFHLQNLIIALTRKLSIFEACCTEQKVFGCTGITHI